MFYYVSGFIGYLLLGLYFRRFVGQLSWKKTLAVALPVWGLGFAIAFGDFLRRTFEYCGGVFPLEGKTGVAAILETSWVNDRKGFGAVHRHDEFAVCGKGRTECAGCGKVCGG